MAKQGILYGIIKSFFIDKMLTTVLKAVVFFMSYRTEVFLDKTTKK